MDEASQLRSIRDGAFCWVSKAALRRLRESCDGVSWLDQAIAVYLTLAEEASNAEADEFQIRRRVIAERSGVSLRRVADALALLRRVGLLTWAQVQGDSGRELAPSRYRLLAVASGTQRTTQGISSTTQGTERERAICTEREQYSLNKLLEEGTEQRRGAAPQAPVNNSVMEATWLAGIRTDPAYQGLNVDAELRKMLRWCAENRKQATRKRFVNWLNRADAPIASEPVNGRADHSKRF